MDSSHTDLPSLLPLREPTFFILLSLANGPKHGYAILKEVVELSQGQVELSSSTLYEALARLLEQEIVRRLANVSDEPHPGRARKAYELTGRGRRLLHLESQRLQALAGLASQRLGDVTP